MSAAPSAGQLTSLSENYGVEKSSRSAVKNPTPQRCQLPRAIFLIFFTKIVMKKIKKIAQAASRWQVVVGVRWQRFQCRVSALYFRRVSVPVQFWRAAGCPLQFRPRLPWWQPFLYQWLLLSGWFRR